jgi:ribosomal protein S27E
MLERNKLVGKRRIAFTQAQGRASNAVRKAIIEGRLPDLKKVKVQCVDCGRRAYVYDHKSYLKPLKVDPICCGCNVARGTNANNGDF